MRGLRLHCVFQHRDEAGANTQSAFSPSRTAPTPKLSLERPGGMWAEAVVAGRFIDADGAPIHNDYDETIIGLTLEDIKGADTRIAVAGGRDKVDAIRACLMGGYISTLVTDAPTAEALLDRQAPMD